MIKAAFIGYGRNAQELHAPAIENTNRIIVTGVYDTNEESSLAANVRFGCIIYSSYAEALEGNFDLAIILTRNNMHTDMACDFMNKGKDVLVTKPWALNAEQANRLVNTAKETGQKLIAWLPCRWSSEKYALEKALASGIIGKPFFVRRSFFTFGKRYDWQTLKEFGGGYLLNWGPHLIDQPLDLIGEPVELVYGDLKQVINPGDSEDMFFAIFKTKSGVSITAEFGIGAKILPDWMIQGDKGTLVLNDGKLTAHVAIYSEEIDTKAYRGKVDVKEIVLAENVSNHAYGDADEIYAHIVQVLKGQCEYAVSMSDIIMLTKILDAVRESSSSGRIINF